MQKINKPERTKICVNDKKERNDNKLSSAVRQSRI